MDKFYTRFKLPKSCPRLLDSNDKVDRLSYVDSTTLVKRFILEGKDLSMRRAHALYQSYDDIQPDDMVPPLPVYAEDPVILKSRMDSMTDELTASLKRRSIDDKKAADNSSVSKANDSSGSEAPMDAAEV